MKPKEAREISFDYADLVDVKLHYATAGSGEKLALLLHGFPEFWYSWKNQLANVPEGYTYVAPDLRGYNLSDKPSDVSDYEIEKLVGDVLGLIKHFGKEEAAIIGHDWGAGVAWATASRHPEVVSKLVCMQVPPPEVWKKNQTMAQFKASWYMFFFQLPRLPEWILSRQDFKKLAVSLKTTTAQRGVFSDEDIAEYKKAWNQPGAITSGIDYYRANIIRRLFQKGPKPEKIKAPTLFIYGEKDHAILRETVEDVGDFIDAQYTELRIPESAHWVQNEAKDKVTEALRSFLAE